MKKKAFGTYEIAKICHVTPSTVSNWIEKGLLPTFTTGGGHRRVWDTDLVAFLKKHNIPIPENMDLATPFRILIVDDEAPICSMIKRIMQKLYPDAEIYEASDGFEAGQKVTQLTPSLVILDLKLPGIDGLKVCKSIRADDHLKNTKILAISGYEPEDSRTQSLAAGANDFLGKPFNTDDLREKIINLFNIAK